MAGCSAPAPALVLPSSIFHLPSPLQAHVTNSCNRACDTPKVVVFDLGKVLVDFDYTIAARKIAARGTMPAGHIKKFIDHSPLLFRYETGRLTNEQF